MYWLVEIETMTVKDLIAELQKLNPEYAVIPIVGWAKDTAVADVDGGVQISSDDNEKTVAIRGWMSDCGASLDED